MERHAAQRVTTAAMQRDDEPQVAHRLSSQLHLEEHQRHHHLDGTHQRHKKMRRVPAHPDMERASHSHGSGGSAKSRSLQSSSEESDTIESDADAIDADAFIAARNSSTRKTPLPAAHEVKYLRHEAALLDREFRELCAKWKRHLPDPSVRLRACEAAKQKTTTMQVERVNQALKHQLLQQQLYFSSLQSFLSESPLWASNQTCQRVFHEIHRELRLSGGDEMERCSALETRFNVAQREALATVDRYTYDHIARTTPATPYSHISSCGTEDTTFLSNIFICKIPQTTLHHVFQATVDHYTHITEQLERHLGVRISSTVIHSLSDSRHYCHLKWGNGDFAGVRVNVTFQANLISDNLAVVIVDFVDQDELFPTTGHTEENPLRKDCVSLLTLTSVYDEMTGQDCVLLRRVLAHRYNLLPNSSRLHKEVQGLVSYLNGDLSMAMLCQSLQATARNVPVTSDNDHR